MMDTQRVTRAEWWRDVVVWGRLIALIVIVVGSALAIWNAIDIGENESFIPHQTQRDLIRQILSFVWYGTLVLIVAEMFSSIRGDDPGAGAINWQVPQLTRLLATIIIVGGTALIIWDLQAMHDVYGSATEFLNLFSRPPGRTLSDDLRYFLEQELQTYLWQSGLLFLLAALVDRIAWRNAVDQPEEEEAPLVQTEA